MDKKIIFFLIFFLAFDYLYAQSEYYLTLRTDTVNIRQGPTLQHPIKLIYKKKFLPVLVIDKSYNFRKIIDHENNSGWIHISQLSKKRAAIVINKEVYIYSGKTVISKPRAVAKTGKLLLIKKCIYGYRFFSNIKFFYFINFRL